MHLAVTLKGIRDCEIAERASRQNLWRVPLSTSYLGEASRQGFIPGFGSTAVEEIPNAVRKPELSSTPNKYAGQRVTFLSDRNRRESHESDQRRFLPGSLTVKGRIL
jgi:hypothetical protein